MPVPSTPCARRTIFAAFRSAAIELWARDGLDQMSWLMPTACRRDTVDAAVIVEDWLPEEYVLAWYDAAWEGPAARDKAEFFRFIDRMMDHGWGRVRSFLLTFATPTMVVPKIPELWRHDHTHGDMRGDFVGEKGYTATLTNHLYTTSPMARTALTEIYRHATSMFRNIKNATGTHVHRDDALIIRIHWD